MLLLYLKKSSFFRNLPYLFVGSVLWHDSNLGFYEFSIMTFNSNFWL